jgi:hypothetical protein
LEAVQSFFELAILQISCLGFRVQGSGFGVQGSGFKAVLKNCKFIPYTV